MFLLFALCLNLFQFRFGVTTEVAVIGGARN